MSWEPVHYPGEPWLTRSGRNHNPKPGGYAATTERDGRPLRDGDVFPTVEACQRRCDWLNAVDAAAEVLYEQHQKDSVVLTLPAWAEAEHPVQHDYRVRASKVINAADRARRAA